MNRYIPKPYLEPGFMTSYQEYGAGWCVVLSFEFCGHHLLHGTLVVA